jgi:hypothetical protein
MRVRQDRPPTATMLAGTPTLQAFVPAVVAAVIFALAVSDGGWSKWFIHSWAALSTAEPATAIPGEPNGTPHPCEHGSCSQ